MNQRIISACVGGLLAGLGLLGCGGDSGAGSGGGGGGGGNPYPTPTPTPHQLAMSQAATFSAGGLYGFEFTLPSAASVQFDASETTTDTWNIAVFNPAEWVSYQAGNGNQAWGGVHNHVASANDTVQVPAGDWFLGFKCDNAIERCMLLFDVNATY